MREKLDISVLKEFPSEKRDMADELLRRELLEDHHKIIVLDDDPTGVQTVHDVSVYTDWSVESIRSGLKENEKLFFILTNSRSFSAAHTEEIHREIAERAAFVSRELGTDYLIISRGDSTLRGHFPLETEILRKTTERCLETAVDGEILCPYFREGGRFTIDDVHYVKMGDQLIPASDTEFAKDKTFGYGASNLREYIEEKTGGAVKAGEVVPVSLEELRALDYDGIQKKLMAMQDFQKMIVNAVNDYDLKVFATAFYRAMKDGKRFLLRTAAAMVKVMGGITDKPLLTGEELGVKPNGNGGIAVIGSHTAKTTEQMQELRKVPGLRFVEINTDLILVPGALEAELDRLIPECERWICGGETVVAYTKRKLLEVEGDTEEAALARSAGISEAVQSLVGRLTVRPAFVVAKGGITSSDVGAKALGVKRARVSGQICPGIPVWKTGAESKFPGIPYVIFPGNVGERQTLKEAVEKLMAERKEI